jgi:hypothetical protein
MKTESGLFIGRIDKKLQALILWISENVEGESLSALMPGGPSYTVNHTVLLDTISAIWDIPKNEIGEIVNGRRDELESSRDHER